MSVNSACKYISIKSMTVLNRKNRRFTFGTSIFFRFSFSTDNKRKRGEESGFSLVEVTIAMLVFLVAMLGIFVTFVYAINYNSGNNSRAQALSVLQKEVEVLRSLKFVPTPNMTDPKLLGGVKAPKTVTSADQNRFIVKITVDDDPFTAGVQIDNTKTIKEITVTVTLDSPTPGWQTSVPATIVLRRSRSN